MWRVQLFLLLSTCFLIPHEAKPATRDTPTLATGRSNNIGRLAAKDLADLLLASMQARGVKLSTHQESTIKALQDLQPQERQSGAILLQLGMDLIIDVLIGSTADISCERVIKNIKHTKDNNTLTLSLKSFLTLCKFNNIECSQKQVVQIIKSTASFKQLDAVVQGSRSTRTATQNNAKSVATKEDRKGMIEFLQARSLNELTAICSSLLQMCGASTTESQNIVQNLVEMGPKDPNAGTTLLQTNGFSTLIVSLMDSMTSIAEGHKSGFCAATPENWIVRLLEMGVAKVVVMSLLTALKQSETKGLNAFTQQHNAVANLVDADVPLKKGAPTFKRSSGSLPLVGSLVGNQVATGPASMITGDGNVVTKLIAAQVPVVANANLLSNIGGTVTGATSGVTGGSSGAGALSALSGGQTGTFVGNKLLSSPKEIITGNNNQIFKVADASIPVLANVAALDSITGAVGGGSGGGASGLLGGALGGVTGGSSPGIVGRSRSTGALVGNQLSTGPKEMITGNNNQIFKVADASIPILANVAALNSITGAVGGGSGGGLTAPVTGLLGGATGGRSRTTGTFVGNELRSGPKEVINGDNNSITKVVAADIPVLANVAALNSITGGVGGGSSGASGLLGGVLGGVTGGSSTGSAGRSRTTGTFVGNELRTGPKEFINGDNNSITKVVAADVPILANVAALNSITGAVGGGSGGGASGLLGGVLGGVTGGSSTGSAGGSRSTGTLVGNQLRTGAKESINGNNNQIFKVADASIPILANVAALNSITGAVSGGSSGGASGLLGGVLGGVTGGSSGSSAGASRATGTFVGNKLQSGPTDVIKGNNNKIFKVADASIPVLANVGALNSITGLVGGGSSSGASGLLGGVLGGVTGGSSTGSAGGSRTTGTFVGNELRTGPKEAINGNNNQIFKVIDASVPVLANVAALNSITGAVGGGSGGGASGLLGGVLGGVTGGSSGGSGAGSTGTFVGNTITGGTKSAINGDNNAITKVLDLAAPIGVNVGLLNNVVGQVLGGATNPNDVVHVLDERGNRLMDIRHKFDDSVGTDVSNRATTGPKQIIIGDNNKITKVVNLDASVLGNINLANAIRGSGGVCIGNELNSGPKEVIEGNNNSVTTLVDIDLAALINLNALNSIIGTVGNDCVPEPPTPEPPTPEPPTPEPPTPEPPTPEPPTPEPPTPQPPTPYPPTVVPPTPSPPTPEPPTPSPPTPSPPTPNPNNCYRRYCRKWRTRPSYLCYKNCGGSYVYRP